VQPLREMVRRAAAWFGGREIGIAPTGLVLIFMVVAVVAELRCQSADTPEPDNALLADPPPHGRPEAVLLPPREEPTAAPSKRMTPTVTPAARRGTLIIAIAPADGRHAGFTSEARVFLNGDLVSNETPLTLSDLDTSVVHTLVVRKSGYREWSERIVFGDASTRTAVASLQRE
jgi:hypothetical protein